MKIERLRGWNVGVERGQQIRQSADGTPESLEPIWILVFSEVNPPSGNSIVFEMNEETKDTLISMLKTGIVTASELPRL